MPSIWAEVCRWKHADGSRVVLANDGQLTLQRGHGGALEVLATGCGLGEAAARVAELPGHWRQLGGDGTSPIRIRRPREFREGRTLAPKSDDTNPDMTVRQQWQIRQRIEAHAARVAADLRRLGQRTQATHGPRANQHRRDAVPETNDIHPPARVEQIKDHYQVRLERTLRLRDLVKDMGPDATVEAIKLRAGEQGLGDVAGDCRIRRARAELKFPSQTKAEPEAPPQQRPTPKPRKPIRNPEPPDLPRLVAEPEPESPAPVLAIEDPTETLAELAIVVGKAGGIERVRRLLNTLETIQEAMRP